jgi:hypothetical protein
MYQALDIFFLIFHTSLVLFNLFGWAWKKTRLANLITLSLTGASWFLLGLFYGGIGYCPLTDWHFQVLHKLGVSNLPLSYIKYLADRISGLDFDEHMVETATLAGFIFAVIMTILLNYRDYKHSGT